MLAFQMSKEPTVKPMPLWVALIYFAASAVVLLSATMTSVDRLTELIRPWQST